MFLFRKLSGRSGLNATHQGNSSSRGHDDDDVSKQALDQASEYVNEGDYEEALWILQRLRQLDPTAKEVAELAAVAEVCNAAILRSCACLPRENRNLDWYNILKVDEKSELSAIKKRYRHLALLLHPDKNKHVKAEAAFKLVSEAYACLSDKKKRAIFNVKKSFTNCKHCSSRDSAASGSDRWSSYNVLKENTSLRRPGSSPDLTQTDWILDQERLRIFRARARARVFGNLENAWKDRGFTGLGKASVTKEWFDKSRKDQNTDQHHFKKRTSDTNQKKEDTFTDPFSVMVDKDLGAKGNVMDAFEQQKVSHQQLFQPCRNLGVLIRDLQAELISSTESRGDQIDEQKDVVNEKSTPEDFPRPGVRGSETHVQDGNGILGAKSEPHIQQRFSGTSRAASHYQGMRAVQETFCTVGNHTPPSSAHGHICPENSLDDGSPLLKNDVTPPNDSMPKKRFDKGYSHKHMRERDSQPGVAETATLECQPVRGTDENNHIRILRQDEDCADNPLKKHNVCRQTRRNDSLDLEETILRSQREKSEQLLKTLQRLREETRTVAASLNHLCAGCSS